MRGLECRFFNCFREAQAPAWTTPVDFSRNFHAALVGVNIEICLF